jgi:L-ascorbate metabolism protein UlaG (beta-lactamase superfamily)
MRNARTPFLVLALLATAWLLAAPAVAAAQSAPVKMEWLSWSHFRFTSPGGKVILTNPFTTNPDSPIKAGDIAKADIILVADGHGDEVGSSDEIAIRTGAKVIAASEMLRAWYADRKLPPAQFLPMGPSDRHVIDGITIRGVTSVHGSGTPDKTYGGQALGFVITFENGFTVYFSGSTGLTLDMQLWGSLYKPDVAILPLSQRRDAAEIAHMVRLLRTENPNLKTIIPHHHRLQPPPGAPTVADMERAIKAAGLPVVVLNPDLSRAYELTR